MTDHPVQVSLSINDRRFGLPLTAVVNVSESLWRDAMEKLDEPTPHADPVSRMLCSDPNRIRRITEARRSIATTIADRLIEYMSRRDTTMGYDRDHKTK